MKLLTSTTLLFTLLVIGFSGGVSGQDVPDFEETKRLAEQGRASAQSTLGVMYSTGTGVPQNYSEAVRWYQLAAEQGMSMSQTSLGVVYFRGQGVPQNDVRAYMWHSVAAAQGNEIARDFIDTAADQLTPDQLARGQDMATRCFEPDYQDCE